jgi:hypothetical protein
VVKTAVILEVIVVYDIHEVEVVGKDRIGASR